jgi:hypothetical protein
MKQYFAFSYLVVLPKENLFRYISCSCGHLWHKGNENTGLSPIHSNHPPLGVDSEAKFTEIEQTWNKGDTIIYYAALDSQACNSNPLFSQNQLQICLEESNASNPQQQVDAILRRIKINLSHTSSEKSVILLSILRH